MALRKRTGRAHFNTIGPGERVRWGLGLVLTRSNYTPPQSSEDPLPVWPSWAAWAETYGQARGAWLAHHAERFDTPPASELLYAAFQRGDDPDAVELPREADPRLALVK